MNTMRAEMRVLSSADEEAWLAALERTVQHDFHHLPQYHRVAEARGEGEAHLFIHEEGNYLIALPLLLRDVPGTDWRDATSVYGYGGPAASHDPMPEDVLRDFQVALQGALIDRRVVSLFSRMHPLIAQEQIVAGLGEYRPNGTTVSIDLTLPEEEQFSRFNKSCRRRIRKLREAGYTGVLDHEKRHLSDFVRVYHETMRRAGAGGFYFFDEAYFEKLARELGDVLHLFVVLRGGRVAAASLAMLCDGIAQDHLGGTADEFVKESTDRLIVDIERLAMKKLGARVLHLGGGVGAQEDSVFKFKAAFSDLRHQFHTWRWVIDEEVYRALCDGNMDTAGYFPAYRAPANPVEAAA